MTNQPATVCAGARPERRDPANCGDDSPAGDRKVPLPPWFARWRAGAWPAVVVKASSIGVAMVGLAAIGTVSIRQGSGVTLKAADLQSSIALPASTVGSPETAGTGSSPSASAEPDPRSHPAAPKAASPTADTPATGAPSNGITADGRVILNIATAEELVRLPSVGEKRARQIVELRARLKRFHSPDDLLRVRGIGVRTLKKMLPHLVLDPPPVETQSGAPPTSPAPPAHG